MKSKLPVLLTAVVGGLITIFLSVYLIRKYVAFKFPATIFGEMEELAALSEYRTKDAPTSEDPALSDRRTTKSFSGVFTYKGERFTVYAYEFAAPEDAAAYYEAVTGRYITGTASFWRNKDNPVYCAYDDTRTICVVGKTQYGLSRFMKFLGGAFTGRYRDSDKEGSMSIRGE